MVDNASLVHHILKNNFSRNDYGRVYTLITLKIFFEVFLVVSHITFYRKQLRSLGNKFYWK
jgi:hypothetical protein